MKWTLDTGALGADGCDGKDLQKVLTDAMNQHATSTADAAEAAVYRGNAELMKDPNRAGEVAKLAAVARTAITDKLPAVQEQMKAGMAAVQLLADQMGGKVTCSIVGHHEPKNREGIFRRLQVSVDRAAPVEE